MHAIVTLMQSLGMAYAAGINLYATVAIVGLAERFGWVSGMPSTLAPLGSVWVIAIAGTLYVIEFLATLFPGIASAWETIHSLIRPPAAAALAAATAWHGDPLFVVLAALLGAGIGTTTHTTKLGMRYAIDTSPEPVTNGAANALELGIVATIALAVWQHPFVAMAFALIVLVTMLLVVRLIWRVLRRVFDGHWMPGRGLLQEPRASKRMEAEPEE